MCPAYNTAYKDEKLALYGLQKNTIRSDFNFSAPAGMRISEIFEDITHNFTELVEEIVVHFRGHPRVYINLTYVTQDLAIMGNN